MRVVEEVTILNQSTAMVCVRRGCGAIWEGPPRDCPRCNHEGIPYKDIEDMAVGAPLPDSGLTMPTTMIQ
jgi:hypothetical protein